MGLFGGGDPGGRSWEDTLAIIGAMLQDTGSAYNGRPGGALQGVQKQFKTLAEQKAYQDSLKTQFGSPTVNTVQSTPSVFEVDPATRYKAMQEAQGRPTMMFSGPTGQALGYDQSNAMLPMLQGLDPQRGLPVLMNALGQAQQEKSRRAGEIENRANAIGDRELTYGRTVADREMQHSQQVQDNTETRLTPQEAAALGYDPKTPIFKKGNGEFVIRQDPRAMTPFQEQSLANDREQMNIARQNASKGAAPPSGYRYKPDGSLEFVPGGPADPAVAGRGTGKPTEDQAKNAQLYTLSKQILPQVLDNFSSLGGTLNNVLSFGGSVTTPESYKQAENGLNSLVANFLYSTSGATATPDEVKNRAATVRPKMGDSAETIELKKKALNDMVESIKLRASPQLLNQQPSAPMPQGAPVQVKSGADYDRLPSGSLYIGPDGQQRRKR